LLVIFNLLFAKTVFSQDFEAYIKNGEVIENYVLVDGEKYVYIKEDKFVELYKESLKVHTLNEKMVLLNDKIELQKRTIKLNKEYILYLEKVNEERDKFYSKLKCPEVTQPRFYEKPRFTFMTGVLTASSACYLMNK